jgi:hypothetical protein
MLIVSIVITMKLTLVPAMPDNNMTATYMDSAAVYTYIGPDAMSRCTRDRNKTLTTPLGREDRVTVGDCKVYQQ